MRRILRFLPLTLGIGISIGPQSSAGWVGSPGNLMWRSIRCFRSHPGADQRSRANRAAGIRHGQGRQAARAHPSRPRTQDPEAVAERLTPR